MIKPGLFASLIAGTAILLGASSASAVEYSIVGANSVTGPVGQTFTINIIQRNASLTQVSSLGASVFGYDGCTIQPDGTCLADPGDVPIATFVSGSAVVNYLNQICVGPGACFGGLDNLAGQGPLSESSIGSDGDRVQIALSAALSPVANDGSADQGLDNAVGTTQFSLDFTIAGDGVIQIGTGYEGDGIVLPDSSVIDATGTTFTVTVPEPGAMLAGLASLGSVLAIAGVRRRR